MGPSEKRQRLINHRVREGKEVIQLGPVTLPRGVLTGGAATLDLIAYLCPEDSGCLITN